MVLPTSGFTTGFSTELIPTVSVTAVTVPSWATCWVTAEVNGGLRSSILAGEFLVGVLGDFEVTGSARADSGGKFEECRSRLNLV
jgi:hypothetical protein